MSVPPKILVTGLAGSGTTWMARVLQELGYNLGSDLYSRSEYKGLEWKPLLELKEDIDKRVLENGKLTHPGVYLDRETLDDLRGHFRARIHALDCPEVVKIPGLNLAAQVLLPEMLPELVIMMHRPLRAWAMSQAIEQQKEGAKRPQSIEKCYTTGALHTGQLLDALEACNGRYTIVQWPKAALNPEYGAEVLSDPITMPSMSSLIWAEYYRAHERATDLNAINYLLPK